LASFQIRSLKSFSPIYTIRNSGAKGCLFPSARDCLEKRVYPRIVPNCPLFMVTQEIFTKYHLFSNQIGSNRPVSHTSCYTSAHITRYKNL